MTDIATKPGADDAHPADAGTTDDTVQYAWAPQEPTPKKRRTGLWIGIGVTAATVGLVASSLVLIAPGTAIAGVPVGWLTPGAAADAVQQRLSDTTIVLTGGGGDAVITGADLGASVDARALADAAFAENPMWNPSTWFAEPIDATVTIDPDAAASALRTAAPELYVAPVDATLAYDADDKTYVATESVDGTGIDPEIVLAGLQDAFSTGETRVEVEVDATAVSPLTTTEMARTTAETLNGVLARGGFYVGDDRAVPLKRATIASWLTVTPASAGGFDVTADAAAIQEVVDTLADKIDREAVNAKVITDSQGETLQELTKGVTGRELGDTSTIASDFAAQLASGDGVYELPVTTTKFKTSEIERRIEVDLGTQQTFLYENGKVVRSYAISSGLSATPTPMGSFRVYAHTVIQDLGALCYNPKAKNSYCTKDVPWLTWFAPDVAFHGAYWHSNFGNPMSHGCVNMPIDVAKFVYDWAPVGTEVWVHA